jgi:hypothetical protein
MIITLTDEEFPNVSVSSASLARAASSEEMNAALDSLWYSFAGDLDKQMVREIEIERRECVAKAAAEKAEHRSRFKLIRGDAA